MAKIRSPNYPGLPLGDALDMMRPVWKAENRNKMSRMVLAKNLGYSSLNGRALGVIGAIRAYGLIEGSGDELRVGEDAITALSAPEGPQKRAAILACAMRPTLFRELRGEFPDTHPSLENLKFQLIQRRFTDEGAGKAAETYLATMRLVGDSSGDYHPASELPAQDLMPRTVEMPATAKPLVTPHPLPALDRSLPSPGQRREIFTLDEGDVILSFPDNLSAESYEDLESFLNLFLRKAKRRVERDNETPQQRGDGGEPVPDPVNPLS